MSASILSLHKPSLSREEEIAFPLPPSLGGNPMISVKSRKNAHRVLLATRFPHLLPLPV